MQRLTSFLMLSALAACADPTERPVLAAIPPAFLAQVDKPVLRGNAAGDVAVLIVGLSGALDQANAQLSAIACLYLKHKAVVAGDPAMECFNE